MNRTTLITLYKYNDFANQLLFDTIAQLDGVDLTIESPSNDSITQLLRHMLMVETAYLHAAKQTAFDRDTLPTDAAGIIAAIRAIAPDQAAYLDASSDKDLSESRTWFGITLPLNQLLMQCAMHSHQHRAEISLLLSQQGHKMTDLDMIKFFIHESGQEWPW